MNVKRIAKKFTIEEVTNGWLLDLEANDETQAAEVGDKFVYPTLREVLEKIAEENGENKLRAVT